MTTSAGSDSSGRALALDALRGLAILAMLLSGQLPFNDNALPAWMYHAQLPPPDFKFNGALPGITWVDLVFPFFLFALGAAFPLALARRVERGASRWNLTAFVLERGFLLAFFALFVQAIHPYTLSASPTNATWLLALLGFALFFPVLMRLPESWPRLVRWAIRAAGWAGVVAFCLLVQYPDGSGFKLTRSDIIIVVLANVAMFGSALWLLTRGQWLPRLGVLGILLAIRLSNMPAATEGWVHDLWVWSPAKWIYQLYYLQYLCIVIPGTIAGDLLLRWLNETKSASDRASSNGRSLAVAGLMLALVLVALVGLKARYVWETVLVVVALLVAGWALLRSPVNAVERLHKQLFLWAIYWLVLGLFFEPYEGGIRKDKATVSYYFITSGLALCTLIFFSTIIEIWRRPRAVRLLVETGQNPMIAYAGINNFITPLLALSGGATLLTNFATTPWRGFCKGAIVTLLMAIATSYCTRKKILWRT